MKKPKIELTKIFEFDSAHKLNNYDGKCKNIHGHTYKLEISISGITGDDGIVMDFFDMNKFIEDKVLNKIDHLYLNEIFEFNPTCENLGLWIWDTIVSDIKKLNVVLEKIVLWENRSSYITLTKEEMEKIES